MSLAGRSARLFARTVSLTRFMSTSAAAPYLLAPQEAKQLLSLNQVKLLDATWFMPNLPRKARDEFVKQRVPGSQFLDLDEVASPNELGLKHMMPSASVFAQACEAFGITPSSHVIIYDGHGVFSAPRALFMFRSFGHMNSSIINGGLPRWKAEGLPTEGGQPIPPAQSTYPVPSLDSSVVQSYEQMVANSQSSSTDAAFVLDARSHERYLGTAPEPRPGLSSGHIPGSHSLPFTLFLQKHKAPSGDEYTTLLPAPELRRALVEAVGLTAAEQIIEGRKPVITSCGSGMTAGVLWLGLQILGVKNVKLYDELFPVLDGLRNASRE
ncbi:hypothetical protein ONZ45_g9606 [Pleurotus djamor]|nr:hypothetical protein ONZ45_g9606 [Pleurotus djamor]